MILSVVAKYANVAMTAGRVEGRGCHQDTRRPRTVKVAVLLASLSCRPSWFRLHAGRDPDGTGCTPPDGQGHEREAGPPPPDGAGAGGAAGQRRRGLPARRDRSDELLRLEAQVPDPRAGRAQGPAAGREEPPDDHP